MGLLETVTFEQRLEGLEGVSHEDFWRKHPRRNSQHKGLKAIQSEQGGKCRKRG